MSIKPLEGRTVWCSGANNTANSDCGWIEAREVAKQIEVVIRKSGESNRAIEMTREEAKTFAAHLMNLAGRVR